MYILYGLSIDRYICKQVHAKACDEDKSVGETGFHYMFPDKAKLCSTQMKLVKLYYKTLKKNN